MRARRLKPRRGKRRDDDYEDEDEGSMCGGKLGLFVLCGFLLTGINIVLFQAATIPATQQPPTAAPEHALDHYQRLSERKPPPTPPAKPAYEQDAEVPRPERAVPNLRGKPKYEPPAASQAEAAAQATAQAQPAKRNPDRPRLQAPAGMPKRPDLPKSSGRRGMLQLEGGSLLSYQNFPDADELAFSARIYVPDLGEDDYLRPQTAQSLLTIASTKVAGCNVSPDSRGWAFFVHEWGTSNRQLRLSWTSRDSACNEMYSPSHLVPYDKWVTVGFILGRSPARARIFLDGEVVADSDAQLGLLQVAGTQRPWKIEYLQARDTPVLFIGAHRAAPPLTTATNELHMFLGFIEEVRALRGPVDGDAFREYMLASPEEALGVQGISPSDLVLQVRFQVGALAVNEVDMSRLDFQPLEGSDERAAVVLEYKDAKPRHPLQARADPAESSSASALPPMDEATAKQYAELTKKTLMEAWTAYKAVAWGHDELRPESNRPKDWMGAGLTILDTMTTLNVMGLESEFQETVNWVERELRFRSQGPQSFFETVIRALGGLAGAHSLANDAQKAQILPKLKECADRLMPAFTHPNGFPDPQIDLGTGKTRSMSWTKYAILAEVATMQMEFRYVSHVTGDPRYQQAVDKAMDTVLDAAQGKGLVPVYMAFDGAHFIPSKVTFGAMADSYYEYLLKQWIQTGKREHRLKDKWIEAMDEMHQRLVKRTAGGQLYIGEEDGRDNFLKRMDHLACFVGGMLELGYNTLPKDEVKQVWHETAEALTSTCHEYYSSTSSGVAPEYASFQGRKLAVPNDGAHYLLRPEAAESIYYMWYFTRDPKYRSMQKDLLDGIRQSCKVQHGYSAVKDVRRRPQDVQHSDGMESFFLAETLKYIYLTFAPPETLDLTGQQGTGIVFNTEAHPMKVWDIGPQ